MRRHTLKLVELAHQDGDYTFHLVVDDEDRPVKVRLGGWRGRPKSGIVEPFILEPDGVIDFGEVEDDGLDYARHSRRGQTDILEDTIRPGQKVTVAFSQEKLALTITRIEELLGSGVTARLPT